MTERAFVDTNVWVYLFDRSEEAKRHTARRLVESASPGSLVVSTQVLQEFYAVTTRRLAEPLTPDAATAAVGWMSALPVVGSDADLVLSAISLSRNAQLSIWDALVVRAAAVAGCARLLSEDLQPGAVLSGVEVVNPFA